MFKRLIWFGSGAATGAAGSWWVKRRVMQRIERFTPQGMRQQALKKAQTAKASAETLVAEGRRVAGERARRA